MHGVVGRLLHPRGLWDRKIKICGCASCAMPAVNRCKGWPGGCSVQRRRLFGRLLLLLLLLLHCTGS